MRTILALFWTLLVPAFTAAWAHDVVGWTQPSDAWISLTLGVLSATAAVVPLYRFLTRT